MRDLRTWSGGDPSEFERQLLDAGRRDEIPSALKQRMAEALGTQLAQVAGTNTGAAGETGASATGQAAAGGGLLFSKTGLWGVLTLALIAGASGFQALRSTPPARAERSAPAGFAAPHADSRISLDSIPKPTAAKPSASGAPAEVVPLADARLRAEVALLDRARQALRAGTNGRVFELLAEYDRSFAPGALAPEAAALHIEALLQHGDRAGADQRANAFFHTYPAHPLSERIRRLLAPRESHPARAVAPSSPL